MNADVKIDPCWREIGVWSETEPQCERLALVGHCSDCHVLKEIANRFFGQRNNTQAFCLSSSIEEDTSPTQRFAVAMLGLFNRNYLVPTECIVAVAHKPKLHSLPKFQNELIKGIAYVEGRLVYGLDVSFVMEMPTEGGSESLREVIILRLQPQMEVALPITRFLGLQACSVDDYIALTNEYLPEHRLTSQAVNFSNQKVYLLNMEFLRTRLQKVFV
ncbi:MAG: chemotaxis protein CheW [Gammaproteobacteria bacterium]|nr:chemotaxis protein CheW [Gammaproteobacteria bacterium]